MEKAFFSKPAVTNPKKLKKEFGLTVQQAQEADVIDDDVGTQMCVNRFIFRNGIFVPVGSSRCNQEG